MAMFNSKIETWRPIPLFSELAMFRDPHFSTLVRMGVNARNSFFIVHGLWLRMSKLFSSDAVRTQLRTFNRFVPGTIKRRNTTFRKIRICKKLCELFTTYIRADKA